MKSPVYAVKRDRDLWYRVTKNGRVMRSLPAVESGTFRNMEWNLFMTEKWAKKAAEWMKGRKSE